MQHFNGYLLGSILINSLCNISMGTYWFQYKLFFHYVTFQWVLIGVNINCSFIMQQFDG